MAEVPNVPVTALEFFGNTLATAGGNKFTSEKYIHALDDLFDVVQRDKSIEFIVVLRKGENAALLGMKDGEMSDNAQVLGRILRPIVNRL